MIVHFQEITDRSGGLNTNSEKRYQRTFQAVTDNPQDGPSVVLGYHEIPDLDDPYEIIDESTGVPVLVSDPLAVVVDIKVIQSDENLQNWRVVVEYAGVEDPVAQPAEVEYDPVPYQKALVDDVNGEPVVNTAGDPFEGGITVDRSRYRLTIIKNKITFDPVATLAYQETINESAFLETTHPPGFAAGTCKLTIGAKRVRRAGTSSFYWQVKYVIDIDRDGWKIRPRSAGFHARLVSDGPAVPMIDQTTGSKYTTPQLLDGGGARLLPGDPPVIAGPTLDGFDGYETKDWTSLAIEY